MAMWPYFNSELSSSYDTYIQERAVIERTSGIRRIILIGLSIR